MILEEYLTNSIITFRQQDQTFNEKYQLYNVGLKITLTKKDANGKVLIDPLNSSLFLSPHSTWRSRKDNRLPKLLLFIRRNVKLVMFVEYLLTLKRLFDTVNHNILCEKHQLLWITWECE